MKRLRVLHVVGNLDVGGSQKLTGLIATGLDPSRFDVTVLNLGVPGLIGEHLRSRNIAVIDLCIPARPRPWDIPASSRAFIRLLRLLFMRPGWDIVHTHLFRTSVLCAIPARVAGSRLFGTVHRIYYGWQPIVERALAPLHEAIVVDSAAVGQILGRRTHIDPSRYVVIHDGIDVEEFADLPSRSAARSALSIPLADVVICEVAHLETHKGQEHLLEAFARLTDPSVTLLLVGDGSRRTELERHAVRLGVTDKVIFTGMRGDLPLILSATDVLALPSEFEGFGIVQAEAMYLGIPVVATDRGGSTEVVVNGSTGFLVGFGDVESLASRLDLLVASPELRKRLGAAGRARTLQLFTQAAMASRYEDLYERRIGPKSQSR